MPNDQLYHYDRVGSCFALPLTVRLQATFASGVATVDATASDPGITLVADSTGDYDVAGLPPGPRVHVTGCHLDPGTDTPATTAAAVARPRSFSATLGTGKVLVQRADSGALVNPPDGSRLYLTLDVESGVAT